MGKYVAIVEGSTITYTRLTGKEITKLHNNLLYGKEVSNEKSICKNT